MVLGSLWDAASTVGNSLYNVGTGTLNAAWNGTKATATGIGNGLYYAAAAPYRIGRWGVNTGVTAASTAANMTYNTLWGATHPFQAKDSIYNWWTGAGTGPLAIGNGTDSGGTKTHMTGSGQGTEERPGVRLSKGKNEDGKDMATNVEVSEVKTAAETAAASDKVTTAPSRSYLESVMSYMPWRWGASTGTAAQSDAQSEKPKLKGASKDDPTRRTNPHDQARLQHKEDIKTQTTVNRPQGSFKRPPVSEEETTSSNQEFYDASEPETKFTTPESTEPRLPSTTSMKSGTGAPTTANIASTKSRAGSIASFASTVPRMGHGRRSQRVSVGA